MEVTRYSETSREKSMNRRSWAVLGLCAFMSVGVLGGLSGCSVTSGQETTGQYVDDATITTKVKSALASNGGMTLANQVGVETGQGVVQLSGFVPSSADKERAEDITRTVNGVKGVTNDLVVQP